MEPDEIGARHGVDRVGRAGLRQAVRMEAVHEAVEHRVGDIIGIFEADLQSRQNLLSLAIDLVRRERGVAHDVGQHPQAHVEAVFHHDHVHVAEIGARARSHRAADEIDRVRELLRRLGRRPLIEQRRRQVCEAQFLLRIRRAAGADQQPGADDRLLVMQHRHDLQTVWKRLQLVGRELHVARGERTGRALGGPLRRLSRGDATEKQRHREEYATETQGHRAEYATETQGHRVEYATETQSHRDCVSR